MSFTSAQCRAARALIDWSQAKLAEASRVSTKTLADFERGTRVPYDRTLADIQRALEAAGVEFTNGGQPGVRMKIFVDAGQRATLHAGGRSVSYYTLQEAKMDWDRLPPAARAEATIEVDGGPTYTANEIDRLYYGPKPA